MNVRFHQQEIRYLISKLLKQFYCLINSIIVTGSLLFNLDMVLLLKIYDQRRQLDIPREILRLKESSDYKEEACKSNSKFIALKAIKSWDDEPGDEPRNCRRSGVSIINFDFEQVNLSWIF